MTRILEERGTGYGKKAGVRRVRVGLERVFPVEGLGAGIPVPGLPPRFPVERALERVLGSRAGAAALSAAMTAAAYRYCAALALIERGGKVAYGGECLVALLTGAVTWKAARWYSLQTGRKEGSDGTYSDPDRY